MNAEYPGGTDMLTIQDMHDAIASALERAKKSQNTADLSELQQLAGYLMRPAHQHEDKDTEYRFRLLAAAAATAREAIMHQRGDD
jgi:hypothetical protein